MVTHVNKIDGLCPLVLKNGSVETGMNLYVHPRTMKILLYTKDSRLRAAPKHGGQGVFLIFIHPSAAQETLSGAMAFIAPRK